MTSVEKGSYGIDLDNPYHRRRLMQTLRLLGTGRGPVLDVGCERGLFAREMARHRPVVGLDLSRESLQAGRGHAPAVRWVQGDGFALPFQAGTFEVVVLNNIVEHVAEPAGMLREARRVLWPGGSVVVSTPNRLSPLNVFRSLLGRPLEMRHAEHVREFTPAEMCRLARVEGLVLREMRHDPQRLVATNDRRWPVLNLFILAARLLRPRGFCYNGYYRFQRAAAQGPPR